MVNAATTPCLVRSSGTCPTPARSPGAGCVRDVGPVDLDRSADGGAHAGDRLDELALSVALDAGDTEDLARADIEVEARHRDDTTVVGDA